MENNRYQILNINIPEPRGSCCLSCVRASLREAVNRKVLARKWCWSYQSRTCIYWRFNRIKSIDTGQTKAALSNFYTGHTKISPGWMGRCHASFFYVETTAPNSKTGIKPRTLSAWCSMSGNSKANERCYGCERGSSYLEASGRYTDDTWSYSRICNRWSYSHANGA